MVPLVCFPGGRFPSLLLLLLLCLSLSRVQGDCTHPNVPNASLRSGDAKDSHPVGTVLRYRCIPGYEPIPGQSLSLTCLATSKWSPENPRFCQGRRCPVITLENGRIVKSTDLRLGDEITLGCNKGFRIVGQKTLRCVLTSKGVDWNRELPLCQRVPCYPPPNIANGRHNGEPSDDYNYGSIVMYTCNPTFSLIGHRTITCTVSADGVNGEWRPAAPECKVVNCPRPHIENGRLTTSFQASYTYGNLIMYTCDRGHTRVGSESSTCGADSAWHPPPPECVEGIFTTAVATTSPGNGHGNTTSAGPTTRSATEEEILHPETGTTPSPKTTPPRDITGSHGSTGIIIGKLTLLLTLLSLTVQLQLREK